MRYWAIAGAFLIGITMPAAARDLDAKFLIERKGKVIGYHAVDVTPTEAGARVETRIEMRVGLGPITLFRYDHRATEIWRDQDLISLVSETDNNGDRSYVDAKRYGEELIINGSGYEGPAPEGAMPSSYWDKGLVRAGAMINTQNGEILDIDTSLVGRTLAPNDRQAEQYRLVGTIALNLWYDGERWVGSNFTVDGEELTYVLVDEPQEFAALESWAP